MITAELAFTQCQLGLAPARTMGKDKIEAAEAAEAEEEEVKDGDCLIPPTMKLKGVFHWAAPFRWLNGSALEKKKNPAQRWLWNVK